MQYFIIALKLEEHFRNSKGFQVTVKTFQKQLYSWNIVKDSKIFNEAVKLFRNSSTVETATEVTEEHYDSGRVFGRRPACDEGFLKTTCFVMKVFGR